MKEQVEELIELTKGETVRKFRSNGKKIYKWYLCGLLKDILLHGRYYESHYYGQIRMMNVLGLDYPEPNQQQLVHMINNVQIDLDECYFVNSFEEESVNCYLAFFRNFLKDMNEKQKTLLMVSEFEGVFEVQKYFLYTHHIFVKHHHWVEITFDQPLIHTIPEFFNYMDLLTLWNDFISKTKTYKEQFSKREGSQVAMIEYYKSGEARELRIPKGYCYYSTI